MHSCISKLIVVLAAVTLLAGCGGNLPSWPGGEEAPTLPDLPQMPDISQLPSLPGLPSEIEQLPGLLNELGLPDLSQIAGLPDLSDLPLTTTPPGGMIFNGPIERGLNVGDRVPGTDIQLVGVSDAGAEFDMAGMRSVRVAGDSLDYDGPWPSLPGATYNLRLRIYRVGDQSVRAAGVHQLTVQGVQPVQTNAGVSNATLRFPFTTGASVGETFAGTTYTYLGEDERGAQIGGLPQGDYPYRKVGDSLPWAGDLRPDIKAEYNLRILMYNETGARVGGTVKLGLPAQ
jgi:hypothetical protein